MTTIDANELTRTRLCTVPGCPDEAAAARGIYAGLCERHARRKRNERQTAARRSAPSATTKAQTKQLLALAATVDRQQAAEAKAARALETASLARAAAQAELRTALRELLEQPEPEE